jgi:AraC-like DNA-binding protein
MLRNGLAPLHYEPPINLDTMKLHTSPTTNDGFVVTSMTQEQYPYEIHSGSEINLFENSLGKVVSREIVAGPFSLFHNFFTLREECHLRCKGDTPIPQLLVALKGNGHFLLNDHIDFHLRQGQFNILYAHDVETTMVFEQPRDLLVFNLHFPIDVLQHFIPQFPVQWFINKTGNGETTVLFEKPGWVTTEILKEISNLLNCPEEKQLREYFFALKAQGLLHLLLLQKYHTVGEPVQEEIFESIREACHIIETVAGEPVNINKLADLANITVPELKKYFKPVVGVNLSTFIQKARLNNAKLLLLETDLAVKEIARLVGYDHEQNFTQAFKKHFKCTPYFFRQRRF